MDKMNKDGETAGRKQAAGAARRQFLCRIAWLVAIEPVFVHANEITLFSTSRNQFFGIPRMRDLPIRHTGIT
jgi:hypothetical protein